MELARTPIARFDSALEESVYNSLTSAGIDLERGNQRIPGNPDFIWNATSTAIFVHGCFWHRHVSCQKGQSHPLTNALAWNLTFSRTVSRDTASRRQLKKLGWNVVILWECRFLLQPESAVTAVRRAEATNTAMHQYGNVFVA